MSEASGNALHWACTIPDNAVDNGNVSQMRLWTLDHNTLSFHWSDIVMTIVRYILVVMEIGDDEHPYTHWHAYIIFRKNYTLNMVRTLFGDGDYQKVKSAPHWRQYCKGIKDGKPKKGLCLFPPTELGNFTGNPGKRTDIINACELIRNGGTVRDLARSQPEVYIRAPNAFEKLYWHCQDGMPADRPTPQVYWFTGASGSGKSMYARNWCRANGHDFYFQFPGFGDWISHQYHGQPVIIFDDFNPDHFKLDDMLSFVDYTPYARQTKGGFVQITSYIFIFTLHDSYRNVYTEHYKYDDWIRRMEQYMVLCHDFDNGPPIPDPNGLPNLPNPPAAEVIEID